jgi:hypothetical protein
VANVESKATSSQKTDEEEPEIKPVAAQFPHVAEWVEGCGWIELSDQDGQRFVVRAMNDGGLICGAEGFRTFGEALVALEKVLAKGFAEHG